MGLHAFQELAKEVGAVYHVRMIRKKSRKLRLNALKNRTSDGIIFVGLLYVFHMEEGHDMDGYMTTKQAAEKWGISVRQVQNHCKNGRFVGIQKVGTNYLIPVDAVKPKYMYVYETDEKKSDRPGHV